MWWFWWGAACYDYLGLAEAQAMLDRLEREHGLTSLATTPRSYLLQKYDPTLPTLLLLGGFHGDEVTGSVGLLHFMERYLTRRSGDRLNLIVIPICNPSGYGQQRREYQVGEQWLDPNRDYPYDADQAECCRTELCQVLFKIYSFYNISLSMTFHGGESQVSITYPPGDFGHSGVSLDDAQYKDLVSLLV
jgi:hypothetical protein